MSLPPTHPDPLAIGPGRQLFARLLAELGAREIDVLDASDYDGAGMIHDLNEPVPDGWKERYDLVYDGGTIEHIFNLPIALRNCMEMVRPGGHLLLTSPANNYFGHGFYQLSPIFFYQALSEANGFRVERMIAVENGEGGRCYEVADPRQAGGRGELINDRPVLLAVQARRQAVVPIFRRMPSQCDYEEMWSRAHVEETNSEPVAAHAPNGGARPATPGRPAGGPGVAVAGWLPSSQVRRRAIG